MLHLYLARGLTSHTHPDEDEFLPPPHPLLGGEAADPPGGGVLAVRPFPFVSWCTGLSGEIQDGKTVTAVLKAKLLLGL